MIEQNSLDAVSPIGKPPMSVGRKLLIWGCAAAVIVCLFWIGASSQPADEDKRNLQADMVGSAGRAFVPVPRQTQTEGPPAEPAAAAQPAVARPGNVPVPRPGASGGIMPSISGMMPSIPGVPSPGSVKIRHFQATGSSQQTPARHPAAAAAGSGAGVSVGPVAARGDALDEKLSASEDADTAVASMLPDTHLFLTMGTGLPCISEQPVNTDVPGPFRCIVRGNVMGKSGAVSLLDDGTEIFGKISESLERGKRRAFGVVTRILTPAGCRINLRAPIADQLGTPGVDGEVDNHFFERFRGVAVLALFDIASQTAAIAASRAIGGDDGISFNQMEMGTRQIGQDTAGGDIDIPPTLKRAEAKRMLIMTMQDIDMRACYTLRTVK